MFSYIFIYFKSFSKIEVQIRSSVVVPKLGRRSSVGEFTDWTLNDRTLNVPTCGQGLNFEEAMTPNLEYDPQLEKIQQWCHNLWSSGIFRRSVFRHSNSVFGLSMLGPIRCSVIQRLVIWCWVPIWCWVRFGVRSFGVRSFDVGSFGFRSFGVRSFDVQSFGVQ
jgi:hypothetical protein